MRQSACKRSFGGPSPTECTAGTYPSSTSELHDSFLARVVFASGPSAVPPTPVPERGARMGGANGRRFELVDRLGCGAMGQVFAARDTLLDRTVAIKFILPRDGRLQEQLVELFECEARTAAMLDHENLVRLFDVDRWNEMPFMVMEYLEGQPLAALLRERRIDVLLATDIMAQTVAGLAHAHHRGVVHRDLNPNNVFILGNGRVKILDFGLAHRGSSRAEAPFRFSGTPPYMAPEQWLGGAQDARTDIWAAGVMFFELLTGRRPFATRNPLALKAQVTSPDAAPSARSMCPEVPEAADRIVKRALQKDPGGRFRRAEEMHAAVLELRAALLRRTRPRRPLAT